MGTTAWLKLCEEDAAAYERGDEWFRFDEEEIMNLRSSTLEAMEIQMNLPVAAMVIAMNSKGTRGVRGMFWVARRLAGVAERFADFDPRWLKAQIRIQKEKPMEESTVDGQGNDEAPPVTPINEPGEESSEPDPSVSPAVDSQPFSDSPEGSSSETP